jgi:hypothetical protein
MGTVGGERSAMDAVTSHRLAHERTEPGQEV